MSLEVGLWVVMFAVVELQGRIGVLFVIMVILVYASNLILIVAYHCKLLVIGGEEGMVQQQLRQTDSSVSVLLLCFGKYCGQYFISGHFALLVFG